MPRAVSSLVSDHLEVLSQLEVILQASKGAVIRFYETLRAELGSHVHVTILTPGYVVSNLTKGKGLQKDGHVGIDEEARDVRDELDPPPSLYLYNFLLYVHANSTAIS